MAGYVVDEQLDVISDGFFDNIEDFLDFSPDDEVLGIVDTVGSKDGGGGDDLQITTDAGSLPFLNLDDRVCRGMTNPDDNKICDDINISEDWVSKFLDDSYLNIDFSATALFIDDKDESQFRSTSPTSVLEPNSLNSSSSSCSSFSSSSCNSSNNEPSDTVSLAHVGPTMTLVPARARSKRPRRAAQVSPSIPIPILPLSSEGPPAIPTMLPECESFGESCPPPMKKKKIKKNPAAGDPSGESGIATRKCLHCGIQKTPQWRGGPMGPKTLCNACGVRYKSGRLFPEYRPAASPTFEPTIHSNSHKKVVEMRIKACEEKVEGGMPLPQYPAAKNSTMSDEEPVDQKKYLEGSCKPKCVRPLRAYQACVERIKGDESGHKHCTGQYFDYWSCVDACVALKLFDKLK